MLEIINRTSYRSHLQNPPTQPEKAITIPKEEPKTLVQSLNDFAANLRAKKQAYSPTILKKPELTKIETVQEVAERIKRNRIKRKENLPLPIQKEVKILYKNNQGIECEAIPTIHCIDQFINRIRIIKPHLYFNNEQEVLLSFAEHFNKTFREGGKEYQNRNRKRHDPESPFVLHGRWYAFIVKPSGHILTFELTGKFRGFNKIHSVKKPLDRSE